MTSKLAEVKYRKVNVYGNVTRQKYWRTCHEHGEIHVTGNVEGCHWRVRKQCQGYR